jgi:hypothetical protein
MYNYAAVPHEQGQGCMANHVGTMASTWACASGMHASMACVTRNGCVCVYAHADTCACMTKVHDMSARYTSSKRHPQTHRKACACACTMTPSTDLHICGSSNGSVFTRSSLRTTLIMMTASVAMMPGTQQPKGTEMLVSAIASAHTHHAAPNSAPAMMGPQCRA